MFTRPAPKTTITKIEKRSNISQKELIAEYIEPSIPVVLTADATRNWKGMGKLTPEFFKKNYSHLTKDFNGVKMNMSEYVDRMMTSTPENPAPYPFNFNLNKVPELKEDIKPEIIYAKSDRVNNPLLPKFMLRGTTVYEFFFGGNGSSFPYLHVDALFLHTQITQIYGSKEFIMYPPEQTPYMYSRPDNPKVSQINTLAPDYEKFPLFRKATPMKILVEQGETILFPTKWWHTTKIHEPCISLGRVQLNAANWDDFLDDNNASWKKRMSVLSVVPFVYGKTLGKALNVWESRK